ncbi:YkoF family thiamine/hydroxymethylpyrimidine-binding protein [Prolixibacteraceae bacterium Z1-6]|uniref:YkoF family thiamine/hydroxymethylpyrimidine-binding protein n=1 Tax=Draconibacterium aestuarii TaxID=2998507 RepID=A0A9X3F8K0_9BACT|nr:YkoF family thiamine/hydroxymethylpyrimidine-binding protein [Prolixibacteraceae bacterium Z1-6]
MVVAVEISLYPLSENFEKPVDTFLALLAENKQISIEPGKMSSILSGELSEIMNALSAAMEQVFKSSPAVFNLKISNCCPV